MKRAVFGALILSALVAPAADRAVAGGTPRYDVPYAVRFREANGQGLLVKTWINGAGPYTFAIDTGAGATILSGGVADEAGVDTRGARETTIGGLSGAGRVRALEGVRASIAIGDEGNVLPSRGLMIVMDAMPPHLDGILDPTEAYYPLGYVLDMPGREIGAFDPRDTPVRAGERPPNGAVVSWLVEGNSRRPFVPLDDRRALLDTGASFGLALTQTAARALGVRDLRGEPREATRDVAGGWVSAQRIDPLTVNIGSMTLSGVPTDVLSGADANSPILLGRDALRPFELTFDPINRLIRIVPE